MKKRFEYALLIVLLIAVAVTAFLDKGLMGELPESFNDENFEEYLRVSPGVFSGPNFGPDGGKMVYEWGAKNLSRFEYKNVVITLYTTEGEITRTIPYIPAGETAKFELLFDYDASSNGTSVLEMMNKITGFSARGEIIR